MQNVQEAHIHTKHVKEQPIHKFDGQSKKFSQNKTRATVYYLKSLISACLMLGLITVLLFACGEDINSYFGITTDDDKASDKASQSDDDKASDDELPCKGHIDLGNGECWPKNRQQGTSYHYSYV